MKKLLSLSVIIMLLATACNPAKNLTGTKSLLNARWSLQSLAGYSDPAGLFNDRIPFLQFDTDAMRIHGSGGCNSLNGPFTLDRNGKLSFGAWAITKMACPGNGESVFISTLSRVTHFKISDNVLTLLKGDTMLMQLVKSDEEKY